MFKRMALAAALLGTVASASASVMFQWVPASGEGLPHGIQSIVTISDQAAADGHISYQSPRCDSPSGPPTAFDCAPDPTASLQRFTFTVPGFADPINLSPAFSILPINGGVSLNADLTIVDGFLQGMINANGQFAGVVLTSVGDLFTVSRFGGDGPLGGGCDFQGPACNGATGFFREVVTGTVPEPTTILIMLGGLIGFVATWRKERSRG